MPICYRLFVTVILLLSLTSPVLARSADTPGPFLRLEPEPAALTSTFSCGYSAQVNDLLQQSTSPAWLGWISKLSGAEPVTVGGQTTTITTRHSTTLFSGQSPGYAYLKEQVLALYPPEQVVEQPFTARITGQDYTLKNLIVTLPGKNHPNEVVILSAHFDDMPYSLIAPGADDNASGSASLLEAARILHDQTFNRTIRIIWFTGEEQGLLGSKAYLASPIAEPSKIVGVINLDMYAYDSNNDRCFELHVETLPQSNAVGQCVAASIQAYQPDLTYDYFNNSYATRSSDHASFWDRGIGAVEIGENFSTRSTPNGCVGADQTPYYHQAGDTIDHINPTSGFMIHRAALAALMGMAGQPLEHRFYFPLLMNN